MNYQISLIGVPYDKSFTFKKFILEKDSPQSYHSWAIVSIDSYNPHQWSTLLLMTSIGYFALPMSSLLSVVFYGGK